MKLRYNGRLNHFIMLKLMKIKMKFMSINEKFNKKKKVDKINEKFITIIVFTFLNVASLSVILNL